MNELMKELKEIIPPTTKTSPSTIYLTDEGKKNLDKMVKVLGVNKSQCIEHMIEIFTKE